MAFNAATQWEYNAATGLNTNGGGWYNAGGSSTDYPAAGTVYAYTDIVIDGSVNTKITSSARPFVGADAGNIINITAGTGFTVQRVQITSVDGSNVATCDKAVGTTGSTGGTGRLGGAFAVPTDALMELAVAGNTIWFRTTADTGDTFTLTENLSMSVSGSNTAAITINSYRTTRGETLKGTARPTIAAGTSYLFWINAFWNVKNIILTTQVASGFYSQGANNIVDNVKVVNSSGTAGRYAFQFASSYAVMTRCEAQSTNGYGVQLGIGSTMVDCYVHDCSNTGIILTGANCVIEACIIDTCATGIDLATFDYNNIIRNTIYHAAGTTGIAGTTSNGNRILRNIITGFTDGVKITTVYTDHTADFNNYYSNTDDRDSSCVPVGPNDIDADPGFTDAPNGNFSVGANCKVSEAMSDIGAVGTCTWYMGMMQTPDFPAVGNVTEDDTVNNSTGTYHEAAAAEVQSGVQFGAGGTEYTGSYVGGGGGGRPVYGDRTGGKY